MSVLNKVEIKNTFRISAQSALEAATIAVTESHYTVESVTLVKGEDSVFVATLNLGRDANIIVHNVVFIELVSKGKYRVEVGRVSLTEFEYTQLTGGDDAVNAVGFYSCEKLDRIITKEEFEKELAHWVRDDIASGEAGRMEGYYKRKFIKVTMLNGEFVK